MKKRQPTKIEPFPFVHNKSHIYNSLVDGGYGQVNCGWKKFTFELHSNLIHDSIKVDGLTEFDTNLIKLEMSLSNEEAKETILHEIMHCVLEGIGLDERNFGGVQIGTTNEFLVTSISRHMVLLDILNPGLFSLIFSKK